MKIHHLNPKPLPQFSKRIYQSTKQGKSPVKYPTQMNLLTTNNTYLTLTLTLILTLTLTLTLTLKNANHNNKRILVWFLLKKGRIFLAKIFHIYYFLRNWIYRFKKITKKKNFVSTKEETILIWLQSWFISCPV